MVWRTWPHPNPTLETTEHTKLPCTLTGRRTIRECLLSWWLIILFFCQLLAKKRVDWSQVTTNNLGFLIAATGHFKPLLPIFPGPFCLWPILTFSPLISWADNFTTHFPIQACFNLTGILALELLVLQEMACMVCRKGSRREKKNKTFLERKPTSHFFKHMHKAVIAIIKIRRFNNFTACFSRSWSVSSEISCQTHRTLPGSENLGCFSFWNFGFYSRFTMRKKCSRESWIFSATQTWWISPWTFTKICTQTKKFHRVRRSNWYFFCTFRCKDSAFWPELTPKSVAQTNFFVSLSLCF